MNRAMAIIENAALSVVVGKAVVRCSLGEKGHREKKQQRHKLHGPALTPPWRKELA